jgi:carboxymethylenebutenolidase
MGPGGGRTSDLPNADAAREAIYKLTPEQVTSDLDAVAAWAKQIPASNGKLAVGGFCWGGGQSFRYATHNRDLAAAFPFYGAFQYTKDDLAKITCPVHGFYGGSDERINATIPETEAAMKELGKTYEPVVYQGAGHGFMRLGEEPDASDANRKAREEAWKRWKELLGTL